MTDVGSGGGVNAGRGAGADGGADGVQLPGDGVDIAAPAAMGPLEDDPWRLPMRANTNNTNPATTLHPMDR